MDNIIIYTFKSFPSIKIFRDAGLELFTFGRLRLDLDRLLEQTTKNKPRLIIGIAKSTTNISNFESKAVNIFNKDKKIDMYGQDVYELDFPKNGYKNIRVSKVYTDSFCNWTMYNISEKIQGSDIKLQFIHITNSDLPDLVKYINIQK